MTFKIAHTGDLHWGLGYPGPSPQSRFEDITEVADWMADVIIAEGCNLVLVAGDLFKDARVFLDRASVEIAAAVRWLRRFSGAGIPVIVISGTPSHDAIAAYEIIREMRIPYVDIITTPDVLTVDTESGSLSIACLPGINRSTIASKEEFSRLSAHELHQLITDRLANLTLGLAAQCDHNPKILLSHITCTGADKGWEDLLQQNEPVLTKAAIEGAGFALVCLGHLHNAHRVEGLKPFVYYCGSPERLRFDEEGNSPGFWIHEVGMDSKPSTFVETPARRFYTLDFPWCDEDPDAVVEVLNDLSGCLEPIDTAALLARQQIRDAIVRVRYECTEAQAKLINQAAITRDLYELGAFYVQGIEAKIQRTTRTRAAAASSELKPSDALQLWGEVNQVDVSELAELTTRGQILEQEVGIGG